MNQTAVFDIEANGLAELMLNKGQISVREGDSIHLLVIRDFDTDEVFVYRRNTQMDTIEKGFKHLKTFTKIVGHNVIDYDLTMLHRLYPHVTEPTPTVFDTLVASRLLWPDAKNHPFGGNSLDALGAHIGVKKTKYTGSWEQWTQEMEDYCVQDTLVAKKILQWLIPKVKPYKTALKLEHKVAQIIAAQRENGVTIDTAHCQALIDSLVLEQNRLNDELGKVFPPKIQEMKSHWWVDEDGNRYVAKKDALVPVVKGPLKTKTIPFNPGSSQQISERLKELHGWEAPLTEAGNPSVTEEILIDLPYPEARLLVHVMMIEKRLQHLQDWTTRAVESRTPGRIHPGINPNGAATGRMTHSQPNQTAAPKVVLGPDKKPLLGFSGRYGWEMRSAWRPREGWLQLGGDASGLEYRMLGNRLARYDGGAYAKEVVSGDIHTLNMKSGGLQTRDQSKTAGYAYLYGSGDAHLGEVISSHPSLSPEQRVRYKGKSHSTVGKTFRQALEKNLPALSRLVSECKHAVSQRGYVTLLDGRRAPTRSAHSALNTLLQGDGAIVMKLSLCLFHDSLLKEGLQWERDFAFMLNAHDEFQLEVNPDTTAPEELGKLLVKSIKRAGILLKCQCPLDGEYKIGRTWAETH